MRLGLEIITGAVKMIGILPERSLIRVLTNIGTVVIEVLAKIESTLEVSPSITGLAMSAKALVGIGVTEDVT